MNNTRWRKAKSLRSLKNRRHGMVTVYVALGLMIFLAYELKRFFGGRSWWKYIEWLQIVGMAAIFVHAIELGGELRLDWFMAVWVFYGVTLSTAVIYSRFIFKSKEGRDAK